MLTFSFMETFFFLSLGITFVLILLLVYHFKQRLTKTEHQVDTLFDIVQKLVAEVTGCRKEVTILLNKPEMNMGNLGNLGNYMFSSVYPNQPMYMEENEESAAFTINEDVNLGENIQIEKITEYEEEDEYEEDGDEDEDEDEDEEDEDEDEDENVEDYDDDEDDEDAMYLKEEFDVDNTVDENEENLVKIKIDDSEDAVPTEVTVHQEEIPSELEGSAKVDDTQSTTAELPLQSVNVDPLESYKKMTLNALKQYVLAKGLAKDVSRMKKGDLLKLIV